MMCLVTLAFTFVALSCDAICATSSEDKTPNGVIDTSNGYYPYQQYIAKSIQLQQEGQVPLYKTKGSLSSVPEYDSNKQRPLTVIYQQDPTQSVQGIQGIQGIQGNQGTVQSASNNHATQQYQTFGLPGPLVSSSNLNINALSGIERVPFATNQHGYMILAPVNQHNGYYTSHPSSNQYSVNQPLVYSSTGQSQLGTGPVQFYSPNGYSRFYTPMLQYSAYNEQHPASDFRKISTNQQVTQQTSPPPKIYNPKPSSTPAFEFKNPPLFEHHVYHPLHTSIKYPQQNLIRKPNLAPPTPRIYKNFSPMLPSKRVIPVTASPARQPSYQEKHNNQEKEVEDEEEDEDKAEVNNEEEDEEENDKVEEDDKHSNFRQEENIDNNDHFFDFSGKYRHDDDHNNDDNDSNYKQDKDEGHDSYRSDSKQQSENRSLQSKLSSKYKYPKSFAGDNDCSHKAKFYFEPFTYEHKAFDTAPDFAKPNTEFKMYKYSMSSKKPEEKEHIQGKGSEIKPIIQHNQKSYQSKWIISSELNSSNHK